MTCNLKYQLLLSGSLTNFITSIKIFGNVRLQHRVCISYCSLFCSPRCYKYLICPIKFCQLFGFNPKLVPYYRNVKTVYIPWRVSNTFILQTPPHFSVESPGQLVLHSDRGTMTSAGGATWPHQHSCPV